MDETPTTETNPTDEDALKRRLLNRIAVAAVMVVGLLGSLAMFDAIYAPSRHATTKVAALPLRSEAPAATEPAATAETKPAEPAAETKPEPAIMYRRFLLISRSTFSYFPHPLQQRHTVARDRAFLTHRIHVFVGFAFDVHLLRRHLEQFRYAAAHRILEG